MPTQHMILLPMSLWHWLCLASGVELLDVKVLPVNILALQQQLGDALGLFQHLIIALRDLVMRWVLATDIGPVIVALPLAMNLRSNWEYCVLALWTPLTTLAKSILASAWGRYESRPLRICGASWASSWAGSCSPLIHHLPNQ